MTNRYSINRLLVFFRRTTAASAMLIVAAGAARSAPAPAPPLTSGFLHYEDRWTLPASLLPPEFAGQARWLVDEHRLWFKGMNYRDEETKRFLTDAGVIARTERVTSVAGPGGVFMIDPSLNREAVQVSEVRPLRLPDHIPGLSLTSLISLNTAVPRLFGKRIGSERVGQYVTDVYVWDLSNSSANASPAHGPIGPLTHKFWLKQDLPVPVKVVAKDTNGLERVSVLKAIELNGPIAESRFQLPKGTTVRPSAPKEDSAHLRSDAGELGATGGKAVPGVKFVEQASYAGDPSHRPAGTVCIGFGDQYRWLIEEAVIGREQRGFWEGRQIEVALGTRSDYYHVLGTNLVARVPR